MGENNLVYIHFILDRDLPSGIKASPINKPLHYYMDCRECEFMLLVFMFACEAFPVLCLKCFKLTHLLQEREHSVGSHV